MDLGDYDYSLPKSMIAQSPALRRDQSKLLTIVGSDIVHDTFKHLNRYLGEGDVLVINESKVKNAKLVGMKDTGGMVELLLLNTRGSEAECLIRGRRIRGGTQIRIGDVTCEVTNKIGKYYTVRFDENLDDIIERFGETPIPYYIKEPIDHPDRYQTIYARSNGSVAAPTAGLHFTEDILKQLEERGVKIARLTLHIGPSTFMPLESTHMNGQMFPEHYSIETSNADLINEGIEDKSLVAVGTSTVKTLESAAVDGMVVPGEGDSNLFITPGYQFKVPIKGMITNFHLPKSSLLLLVCALFGRERVLEAYKEAISRRYRFYSFGDAMLIMGRSCLR